jgi:hypothetical protein
MSPKHPEGFRIRFLRTSVVLPLVWLVVGLLFAAQLVLFDAMPVGVALGFAALDWLPWILVSPLVLWLGRRFEFTLATWGRSLCVHGVACLLLTFALELEFSYAMQLGLITPRHHGGGRPSREARKPAPGQRGQGLPQAEETQRVQPASAPDGTVPPPNTDSRELPSQPRMQGMGQESRPAGSFLRTPRARMSIPLYWVLVAVAHALLHHRRSGERERRALQAEATLAETRLAMLQAQLNPHFLFNTLNTLAQFVHEDPAASERMIEGLARLLRASLAASGRRLLPLREELGLADAYLEIQRNRFPDRLSIVREIDPALLDCEVPTLLIQPLVENAVLHGIAPHRHPGVLTVRVRPVGNSGLCIEIIDTGDGSGSGMHGAPLAILREGVGLRNTRERLASLYGDQARFELLADRAGGACSRVTISGPALAPSL